VLSTFAFNFNLRLYSVVGLGIIYQTALAAGETSMARFHYPLPSLGTEVEGLLRTSTRPKLDQQTESARLYEQTESARLYEVLHSP